MKRSKGTYLQGVQYAEEIMHSYNQNSVNFKEEVIWELKDVYGDLEPYYEGYEYCKGFCDYINYFIDNKELIFNHFKGLEK